MTTVTTTTAEQLLQLPNNHKRRELVRGEIREVDLDTAEHGEYAMYIGSLLAEYAHNHSLGQTYAAGTGFILSRNPDTVRAPDAAFVRREVLEQLESGWGYLTCPPDLAIEVTEAGDTYTEVHEKVMEWLDSGCRMVVVVDPRRKTVTVYRSRNDIEILTEEDTLLGGDVVEGWELPVRELFS